MHRLRRFRRTVITVPATSLKGPTHSIAKVDALEGLAHVFGGVTRFLEEPAPADSWPAIRARFTTELSQWFHTLPLPEGYHAEAAQVKHMVNLAIRNLNMAGVDKTLGDTSWLRSVLASGQNRIRQAVLEYPDEVVSCVLPEASPFAFYCWLRSQCATAKARLVLVDAYVSPDVFYNYLRVVPPAVDVTLVTNNPKADVLAVSRVFANERTNAYSLMSSAALHDRGLIVDNRAFHLGASVKDAGRHKPVTINSQSVANVEALLAGCVEVFGRNRPAHP